MPKKPAPIPADLTPASEVLALGEMPTEHLVEAAFALRGEIKEAQAQLAEVESLLIAKGAGKHSGSEEGHTVLVLAAVPAAAGKVFYTLSDEDEAKEAELEKAARELAGDKFGDLFDRHVSYVPCTGFEAVAPKLLTPAKSRDLLALCARQGAAYGGRKAFIKYP